MTFDVPALPAMCTSKPDPVQPNEMGMMCSQDAKAACLLLWSMLRSMVML